MAYIVKILEVPRRHLAVTRFHGTAAEMPQKFGPAFGAVAQYLSKTGTRFAGPAIAHYVMRPDGFDVSAGFEVTQPIEGDGTVMPFELPAGEVATTEHLGSYDSLRDAYQALGAYAAAHGRSVDDAQPMWEEYWSGPDTPPEKTRTTIFWPLKAR